MGIITRTFVVVILAFICIHQVAAQCDIKTGAFGNLGLSATLGFYNLSQINLKVCHTAVQGSIPGYVQLANGTFDIFTGTLTDNAFSRYFDPASYPGQTIVMLGENSLNSAGTVFGARWNITTFEKFRGTNILVDSPVSGFILTFRRVLAFYGLFYERGDFNLIPQGANRFPSLYAGWAVANGVNYSIAGTVVSPPQGIDLLYDPNYYAPQVRSLGALTDYILPLAGGSPQTRPETVADPVKGPKVVKVLAALILANRFATNPANKPYLLNLIAAANPGRPAGYISLTYDYSYGSLSGLSTDFTFNKFGLLNAAYIKQQFGGAPFNTTDYTDLLTSGPGHLINYVPKTQALTLVQSIQQINLNIHSTDIDYTNQCVYPSKDKYVTVSGLATGLKAKVTGGCLAPSNITVTLTGCTSNSTYFFPAQCVYNAASDILTFNGDLDKSETVRFYFINYVITEPCGSSISYTTTTSLYDKEHDAPGNNCIDISQLYHN